MGQSSFRKRGSSDSGDSEMMDRNWDKASGDS